MNYEYNYILYNFYIYIKILLVCENLKIKVKIHSLYPKNYKMLLYISLN